MATSTFDKMTDGITQGLHGAGERIVDFKDDATRDLGKRADTVGKLMKKHPVLAVSIGLGVGYAVARLLHRR